MNVIAIDICNERRYGRDAKIFSSLYVLTQRMWLQLQTGKKENVSIEIGEKKDN